MARDLRPLFYASRCLTIHECHFWSSCLFAATETGPQLFSILSFYLCLDPSFSYYFSLCQNITKASRSGSIRMDFPAFWDPALDTVMTGSLLINRLKFSWCKMKCQFKTPHSIPATACKMMLIHALLAECYHFTRSHRPNSHWSWGSSFERGLPYQSIPWKAYSLRTQHIFVAIWEAL